MCCVSDNHVHGYVWRVKISSLKKTEFLKVEVMKNKGVHVWALNYIAIRGLGRLILSVQNWCAADFFQCIASPSRELLLH